MATVKRQTSRTSRSDYITLKLYTIVNGVIGHIDGNISLVTLLSFDALFVLDEMSDGKLS